MLAVDATMVAQTAMVDYIIIMIMLFINARSVN